jgi:hypothetical protein
MKNATVEDVIASLPHNIIPTVQGEPEYHTIQSIRKLLSANARSIKKHLGGGALGHFGIIVLIPVYATVAPAYPWVNPESTGRGPAEFNGGTIAQLAVERRRWEMMW